MPIELREHPFRHVVLDDRWDPGLLDAVFTEFPGVDDPRWIRYNNEHEVKLHGDVPMWGPATVELIDQFRCLASELSGVFDVPDLRLETVGGGMHLIPPGGKLDVHVDFNRSPESGRYRRLNLMCYLNRNWVDPGGLLMLEDETGADPVDYAPEFNRTVVFESSDRSWHGHPIPAHRHRASVAAYYFSEEPPVGYTSDHSTVWRDYG